MKGATSALSMPAMRKRRLPVAGDNGYVVTAGFEIRDKLLRVATLSRMVSFVGHLVLPLALSSFVLLVLRSTMFSYLPIPAVVLVLLAPMYAWVLWNDERQEAGWVICTCIGLSQIAAGDSCALMSHEELSAALQDFTGPSWRQIRGRIPHLRRHPRPATNPSPPSS